MSTIALMGAGGKMGLRIARNLKDNADYKTFYVEVSDAGKASLAELGLSTMPQDEALQQADVVILALPDRLIGKICDDVVPKLRSGTMVMGLDPAAAYAGALPEREDISYFISHPCHPPIFGEETDIKAQRDWFGGVKAQQNIVCSLHYGPEKDFAKGEAIARIIFAPVLRVHRVTTEQMAILEPALVETLTLTCFMVIHDAMEEVIKMGLPKQAVMDFLLGHIRTLLAIVWDFADAPVSDGAKLASIKAREQLFQSDWKKVLKIENVRQSVKDITGQIS